MLDHIIQVLLSVGTLDLLHDYNGSKSTTLKVINEKDLFAKNTA